MTTIQPIHTMNDPGVINDDNKLTIIGTSVGSGGTLKLLFHLLIAHF